VTDVGRQVNTVALTCLSHFLDSLMKAASRFEAEVFDAVSAV
jgi:hypothetical protein